MLKRNDLSKQFELVVQQEIKNFQDASYQINQRLNDVENKIENLESSMSKKQSLLESRHKSLSIEIELMRSEYEKANHKLDSYISDTQAHFYKIEETANVVCANAGMLSHNIEQNQNQIDDIKYDLEFLDGDLKGRAQSLELEIEQHRVNVNKIVSILREDIIDLLPFELEKVKRDLEDKISSHKIDADGLLKELRVTRKQIMVIEKNLENIYSIIKAKTPEVTL